MGKIDVLTGFKYIGEQIKGFEETGSHTYLFGFEESYGCLAGTYARDKDGVYAAVLVCEMAAYYKEKGMTLYEALLKLYEKYGYYRDGVKSMTMKGLEGMARIQATRLSWQRIIRHRCSGTWKQGRKAAALCLFRMYCIIHWKMGHGYVSALPVQSRS